MSDALTKLNEYITDGTPADIRERYASLKEYAAVSDFGRLDEDVVVLDTETTGFSQNHDELTQIAAARMKRGRIVEWFVTFVNPGKPIPEEVARLTDIHDEDVADAPPPDDARIQLAAFVGDSCIVAHNAAFDKGFCTKSQGGAPLSNNLWIDSLDLARIALPRLKSHRLIDIVKAFDAPVSTHRADADVEALCAAYRIMLAAIAKMPKDLVSYIAELADADSWPTGAVFKDMANFQQAVCEAKADSPAVLEKKFPFTLRALRSVRFRAASYASAPRASDTASDAGSPKDRAETGDGLARRSGEIVDLSSADRPLELPSQQDLDAMFDARGVVGEMYAGYEPRMEQKIMASEVLRAFSTSTNLVVEAGTGVGKSMAYLLPSAMAALRNGIPVGVATKTNALLDQIVYKELPLLHEALAAKGFGDLRYVALKGFRHYPCLLRIDSVMRDGVHDVNVSGRDISQAPSLAGMLSFIEQTEYDDIDGLKIDYRVLPRYAVTTESRDCLRRKCPFYGTYCFVHGSRKKAERSHIVVTNHSLFFRDVSSDGSLLPKAPFWVVDEAHGAEAEARRALSVSLDASEMLRLSRRLASDESARNPFVRLERRAPECEAVLPEASTLFFGLTEKAKKRGKDFAVAAATFAHGMKDLSACATQQDRRYDVFDLWINDDVRACDAFVELVKKASQFREAAERLASSGSELVAFLEETDGLGDVQRDIATIAIDVKSMLQACEAITETPDRNYVYSAHVSRKPEHVAERLEAMLIDVGQELDQTLYERTRSIVYASATLSVGHGFSSFNRAMGLGGDGPARVNECLLGSSYDFENHMRVFVLNDIPDPRDPAYLPILEGLLARAHIAQGGSMLTLFTNRREMETCFDDINPRMKEEGLRVVCQKWGVSTKGLRDEFIANETLSLFALKSFWEGFDAPGSTLKGVIIPRLPFSSPNDPLSKERAAREKGAWSKYCLPAAVIDLKQAAGRLIRSSTDTGILILADRRLVTMGYGRTFLRSLPSQNITVCSTDELIEAMTGGLFGSLSG